MEIFTSTAGITFTPVDKQISMQMHLRQTHTIWQYNFVFFSFNALDILFYFYFLLTQQSSAKHTHKISPIMIATTPNGIPNFDVLKERKGWVETDDEELKKNVIHASIVPGGIYNPFDSQVACRFCF